MKFFILFACLIKPLENVHSFTFSAALTLQHTIPASEYESVLAADGIVNIAVVIKDVRTKERVLDSQEFNISSAQISIEVNSASLPTLQFTYD